MNRGVTKPGQIKIFLNPLSVRVKESGGFCISKTTTGSMVTYEIHYVTSSLGFSPIGFETTSPIDRTTFDALKGQAKRNFVSQKSDWSESDKYEIYILGLKI